MISRWFDKKEKAIELRKDKGYSIGYIEEKLGIPRSTLSGWFKNIALTDKQRAVLDKNWRQGMVKGRKKAVLWHNRQKQDRLDLASTQANESLSKLNTEDITIIELALSMLYFGEGFKKGVATGMGNSDPLILKFFIKTIERIYGLSRDKMNYDLHLRADQNIKKIKKYWSKELVAPVSRFISVSVDKRTEGRPTYEDYKGVCIVNCGNVAIQRKLVYLSRRFCEKIINMGD